MYVALPWFLLRAPLLPERALGAARALERHPLGATALALASEELAAAGPSERRRRARDRYARRAAFRSTPHGLLAGVCVGELGASLRVATGAEPRPWLAPAWGRMAALGRALLDDAELRARVRLRSAPSLLRTAGGVRWLAAGAGAALAETHEAGLDAWLAAVLDACAGWAPWPTVRAAAASPAGGGEPDDGDAVDEMLLAMVDGGLLHADVVPPLVGPPAGRWMHARLAELGRPDVESSLEAAQRALEAGDLEGGRGALRACPGAGGAASARARDVQAVLRLEPRRPPSLPRAAVARAAALAPLLYRLQEALAGPALERRGAGQQGIWEALDAAAELRGEGAFDVEGLEAGAYGVARRDRDEDGGGDGEGDGGEAEGETSGRRRDRAIAAIAEDLVEGVRGGAEEVALDPRALEAAVGTGVAPPATCELFLVPARARRGARPGTGWLLGMHGPAGASWGRFAAALGAPMARALDALAAAERAARPHEERLDVAYAPGAGLADLCAHPRTRARALALTSWPAARDGGSEAMGGEATGGDAMGGDAMGGEAMGGGGDGGDATGGDASGGDLVPADLAIVTRPPLEPALRARAGGGPLVPSPLARVRSTTAPAGPERLLVGWSLQRQHAPWALAGGPLATLARLPRLSLDGFVVSPASWRIPAALRDGRATRAKLARWRRAAGVPRWIQTGDEDQLLPVDLDAAGAGDDLRGRERAWELWPPLGETADGDGRRVEAVVALVDLPDRDGETPVRAAAAAAAARVVAGAGRVAPAHEAPPAAGWRTFKLFGPAELQDDLLVSLIAPLARAARRAREIRGWHFVRYADGPGWRPHLRLRVQLAGDGGAFGARLDAALGPLRTAGAVVVVETAEYQPESARFGGTTASLAAAHALFEADSALACALLALEGGDEGGGGGGGAPDRAIRLVQSLDALARGFGLDLGARHALARARRAAEERLQADDGGGGGEGGGGDRSARDAAFRVHARALRAALVGGGAGAGAEADDDPGARALTAHVAGVARATKRLGPEARATLLPPLLHLSCVRLWGPDRAAELDAYTLWERTLEGLLRSPAGRVSSP